MAYSVPDLLRFTPLDELLLFRDFIELTACSTEGFTTG
jgi:hypothetical protein